MSEHRVEERCGKVMAGPRRAPKSALLGTQSAFSKTNGRYSEPGRTSRPAGFGNMQGLKQSTGVNGVVNGVGGVGEVGVERGRCRPLVV